MARFKPVHRGLKLLPAAFDKQLQPGRFEHALCYLIEHEDDLAGFHARRAGSGSPGASPPSSRCLATCAVTSGWTASPGADATRWTAGGSGIAGCTTSSNWPITAMRTEGDGTPARQGGALTLSEGPATGRPGPGSSVWAGDSSTRRPAKNSPSGTLAAQQRVFLQLR